MTLSVIAGVIVDVRRFPLKAGARRKTALMEGGSFIMVH